MQIWAEPEKAALPICNYSQILYQFLTFTQNLKRSLELGENPALFLFYLPAFSFNFAIKPFFFLAGASIGPRIPFTAVM